MSADLLPPKASPAPTALPAAPVSGGVPSADDRAETAGRFGQALASAQREDTPAPADKAATKESEKPDGDKTDQAQGNGELRSDLLAALLAQQTPLPVNGPTTQAQPAEGIAADALALTLPSAQTQSVAALLAAGPTTGADAETSDEAGFDAALNGLTAADGEGKATPSAAKSEGRSVADLLQTLSGALNAADGTAPGGAVPQTPALVNSSLSHIQAQTLPQTDSGVRFTPAPPTAPQTVQTYTLSAHTAENLAALSAQITRRLGSKSTSFDMELRPADMGKVDVKLEIGQDGKLTAHLRFDSPVAESEFRGRQDDLRRQLEQAGFQMDDASLNFASGDQGRGRQYAEAERPTYDAPSPEPEAVTADAHSLIDAQLMAAASVDSALYAQMSADGYGPARTLSLSVLV
ncbi:flagellar hook-length control protein FliK [Asticcacaulis sp. DXS10W]|uniref:Flagellar hook-length control protein FliK n=1 Tax=Asticcacaulis currens TaxID=2984210 RepID=A0ABT5ID83_9CAUL|nr:flagellar hook-length control protein FliK [Asticcacaulis currens]